MNKELFECKVCKQKYDRCKEYLQQFADGRIHVRGVCPHCGVYQKYVAYSDSTNVSQIIRMVFNDEWEALQDVIDSIKYIEQEKSNEQMALV